MSCCLFSFFKTNEIASAKENESNNNYLLSALQQLQQKCLKNPGENWGSIKYVSAEPCNEVSGFQYRDYFIKSSL